MPRGTPLPSYEVSEIMARYKAHLSDGVPLIQICERIGKLLGREPNTIGAVIRRLRPTTNIASDYIKANAFKLAHKVVAEANVNQAIDILSRPNIGVLDPIAKGGENSGGFFLSVNAGSCGAVNIAVQQNQSQLPAGDIHEEATDAEFRPSDETTRFFGRSSPARIEEARAGKGNPFKRGDGRRPNRGTGKKKPAIQGPDE